VQITATGARLWQSSQNLESGISWSIVWRARSRSLWPKLRHQTRSLTHCDIVQFPVCGAHTVTTQGPMYRARCRAVWSNEATIMRQSEFDKINAALIAPNLPWRNCEKERSNCIASGTWQKR
jgi:hypothetical protein